MEKKPNPFIDWEALRSAFMPPMPPVQPMPGKGPGGRAGAPGVPVGPTGPDPARFADMYNIMAEMEREYTYNQVNCIDVEPGDTVLDIGCGPGRVSCAMAERAKSVTALDINQSCLDYCLNNAKERGLDNVSTVLMDWNDVDPGVNVGRHDIVIASRNPAMFDVRKLNDLASKYAVIIGWANAPCIPPIIEELFKDTEPERDRPAFPMFRQDRRLSYNINWNIVYDMGAEPNIRNVKDGFTKTFDNEDEAVSWLRRIRAFEDEYIPVFKKNLEPYMTKNADGSVTFRRETRSFVLWWKTI